MDASRSLLVVDDDPVIRDLMRDCLQGHGFAVMVADGADAARAALASSLPDLVLLDVGLPGEDGLSLARYIREQLDIPIIIVSGAGESVDRVIGLEVGADDYVAKPFDPRELRARIKTVLRRYRRAGDGPPEPAGAQLRVGPLTMDLSGRRLFDHHGREIRLTRMEFDLLHVFVSHPRRVLSRDQLLNLTQNRDWDPYDRSIDIRVARLRRKIHTDLSEPEMIRTVRGIGYMFMPGDA